MPKILDPGKPLMANEARINDILSTIDRWDFNIFDLADATNGKDWFASFDFERCFVSRFYHSHFLLFGNLRETIILSSNVYLR